MLCRHLHPNAVMAAAKKKYTQTGGCVFGAPLLQKMTDTGTDDVSLTFSSWALSISWKRY